MNHTEIINYCLSLYNEQRYLEIGVAKGYNFININASHKEGVDPSPTSEQLKKVINEYNCLYFQMTSDEYFNTINRPCDERLFDVVFINGFHEYTQAFRDISNGLNHISEQGIIIVHDCIPPNKIAGMPPNELAEIDENTRIKCSGGAWTGDVWKAIVQLRSSNDSVRVFTLDCDYGCAIITKGLPESVLSYDNGYIASMNFEYLQNNCSELLNLKPVSYFIDFLQKAANRTYNQLYVEDLSNWLKPSLTDYYIKEDVKVLEVDNGVILPLQECFNDKNEIIYKGGACDSDLNFIAGFTRNRNRLDSSRSCSSSYKIDRLNINKSNETVVFCGFFFHHFGHFFLESLSRLWWVIDNPNSGYKFAFLTCKEGFRSENMDFLVMLGINNDDILHITKPTQFRKVLIPDQSFYVSNGYTDKWIGIYDRIRDSVSAAQYEKIYLSRSALPKQDSLNESYYEEFFQKEGYEIIYPEQLNIKEQVKILAGAKSIACTTGTLSHLALFCHDNVDLIVLNRDTDWIPSYQFMINQARSVKCTFIDATWNLLPTLHNGPVFLFYPTKQWKEYLADHSIINDTMSRHIDDLLPEYIRRWALGHINGLRYQQAKDIPLSEAIERICKYLHPSALDINACHRHLTNYYLDVGKNIAIYGTGTGAIRLLNFFRQYNQEDAIKIKCIIENDEYVTEGDFYNLPVKTLKQALETDHIDVIIIGSLTYRYIIFNRIKDQLDNKSVRIIFGYV